MIFRFLPPKHDPWWFLVMMLLTVILVIVFIMLRKLFISQSLNFINILAFCLLAFGIAFLISLFGFLYYKFPFYLSGLGLLLGLGMMGNFYQRGGGWEDLIGPVVLIEFFGSGVLLGILAEIFKWLLEKIKKL